MKDARRSMVAVLILLLAAALAAGDLVLDTSRVRVRLGCQQKYPAIAYDGTDFLAVWSDGRNQALPEIYAARWAPDGTLRDPAGVRLTPGTGHADQPAVAWNGMRFLVVWQDQPAATWDIFGRFVNPDGTPSGACFAVCAGPGDQVLPAVVAFGDGFLVVWQDARGGHAAIYGARITSSGTILDPSGIAIAADTTGKTAPAIAFDGTNALVVWADSLGDGEVRGRRVTPAGALLDPVPLAVTAATGRQSGPAAAFLLGSYLVAWEDARSGIAKLYASRVSPAGTVLDPAGIVIDTSQWWEGAPAIVPDSSDFAVFWHRKPGAGQG